MLEMKKEKKKKKKEKSFWGDIPQGYNKQQQQKKRVGSADNRNRGLSHVRST